MCPGGRPKQPGDSFLLAQRSLYMYYIPELMMYFILSILNLGDGICNPLKQFYNKYPVYFNVTDLYMKHYLGQYWLWNFNTKVYQPEL